MNWIFAGYTGSKNPVYQTGNFKLENVKNQVQIDRGIAFYNCLLVAEKNKQSGKVLHRFYFSAP
jgi:hypothetical protein